MLAEERVIGGTIGLVDLAAPSSAFASRLEFGSGASYPDWSPDGGFVVFQRPTTAGGEPADVHVIAVDGTGERTVTDFGAGGGWAIQPSWAPDGDRIVFVAEDRVRTQANAAFIHADGTGLERMPWNGTFRTHPRVRPLP